MRGSLAGEKPGMNVMMSTDMPAAGSWNIVAPTNPFAEHVIAGYRELISPSQHTSQHAPLR